jgi:hypothetical protein
MRSIIADNASAWAVTRAISRDGDSIDTNVPRSFNISSRENWSGEFMLAIVA